MTSSRWSEIKSHAVMLLGVLLLMWVVEVVDFVVPFVDLDQFGIRPRSIVGLAGILFAPFLHGGFGHLVANSLPFLVLGGMVLLGGDRDAWLVLLLAASVTAAAVRVFLTALKSGEEEAWTAWDAMAVAAFMSIMILTVGHISELRLFLPVAPLVIMVGACRLFPRRKRVCIEGHRQGGL